MSAKESAAAQPGATTGHSVECDTSPAVRVTAGQSLDWLIVCDHASNCIPRRFDSLGLSCDPLQDHIAWDIGAARVARRLSLRLGTSLIESGYSRLLVDCNRYPDAADSIAKVSDGRVIRGNQGLNAIQQLERRAAFFRPYHLAIDAALCKAERLGHTPVFISVHTFVSSMNGRARPWDIGISWTRDERVAGPVLERLAGLHGFTIGDNQPYALEIGIDFTTPEHAMARGLAHLQLELRQDLVSTAEAADRWADQLYELIRKAHSPATWNRSRHVLTLADNVHGIGKWL
jgi:predicted N-formylglutamate amidohydrolase